MYRSKRQEDKLDLILAKIRGFELATTISLLIIVAIVFVRVMWALAGME